ncbi:MAG: hypothetical protein H6607_12395 [Flavobacteriales bacterium]|nr:hypothetical protein [Flavobacteriales bacterium]
MKNLYFLLSLFLTFGCGNDDLSKETIVVQTIYKNSDSTITFDTTIGKPYEWPVKSDNQYNKMIYLGEYCSFCDNYTIDVYWGSGKSNWIRLPFVDNLNNVAINYQWTSDNLFVFAYGDSTKLSSKEYWDNLRKTDLRIRINYK